MVFYVYEWFIIETNEVFYVGKGKNDRYKSLRSRNKFFIDMYNTHNCDVRKIFENLTEDEAFEKEKETIAYYRENTNYRLTNQTDGGEGVTGWVPSDEFREKQRVLNIEKWKNNDYREKIIKIRTDPNGPYKTKEFRDKISKLVMGKNNPNYNHKWTNEQRKHLSEKRKGDPLYSKENNPNAKKIICLETGKVFDCIVNALKKYNIKDESSISVALRDRYRTAGNYHWENFSEELLDYKFRTNYLIESLLMLDRMNPVICIEDMKCYNSIKALSNTLEYDYNKIRRLFKNNNIVKIKNKKYMLLREYKSRYMQ